MNRFHNAQQADYRSSQATGLRARQRGQGMTEYIIIVALIAVAAIATYQFFGRTVRNQTAGIAAEVSGKSATTSITAAQTAADNAATSGDKNKGLNAYNNDEVLK
jgi:Flp pilus assembly pilin Flp